LFVVLLALLIPPTKQLGALKSQLEYIEIDEIISKGMHEYLDDIQRKLNISSAIYNSFFVVQLPQK
jgi:uncharacterized alpha-E superfamily protein